MTPNLMQHGLTDWRSPDDVAAFDQFADDVVYGCDDDQLIEMTIQLLGTLGDGIPSDRQKVRSLVALTLRSRWAEILKKWENGTLPEIGAALKARSKNWQQAAHVARAAIAPRVFAEISFDISSGLLRADAVERACKKFPRGRSKVNDWYDAHAQELLDAFEAAGFQSPISVPERIALAFAVVARDRGLNESCIHSEMVRAAERRRDSKTL